MRPWLAVALTVVSFPTFAEDPPVKDERALAQAYCSHKSQVISRRVFTFSTSKSDATARREFSTYEEKAKRQNSEATEHALQWLSDNADTVDKAISKVRRAGGKGADTLANEISFEALAGCAPARIAEIRRAATVKAQSEKLADSPVDPVDRDAQVRPASGT